MEQYDDIWEETNNNNNNNNNDENHDSSTSSAEEIHPSPQIKLIQRNLCLEAEIQSQILKMRDNLESHDKMMDGVRKVSSFTPLNAASIPTWNDTLIPAMTKSLVQDVVLKNSINMIIGDLRNITISLYQGASLIMNEKGSPQSVAIFIEVFEESFQKLKLSKKNLNEINLSVLQVFEENSGIILQQAGATNAQDFIHQKGNLLIRLKEQQRILENIDEEKNIIIGKIFQLQNYTVSLEALRGEKESAIRALKEQRAQLQTEINALNSRMEEVPLSHPQETVLSYRKGLFRRTKTTVTQVRNNDRVADVNFLMSLARQRVSYTGSIINQEERKEEQLRAHTAEIAEAQSQLTTLEKKLKNLDEGVDVKLAHCCTEISKIHQEMEALDKQAAELDNTYGLRGSILVDFLAELRVFLHSAQIGASTIQPIVSLLENVESMFETPFKMLKISKNPDSVFSCGNLMLKDLGFVQSLYMNLPCLLTIKQRPESSDYSTSDYKSSKTFDYKSTSDYKSSKTSDYKCP